MLSESDMRPLIDFLLSCSPFHFTLHCGEKSAALRRDEYVLKTGHLRCHSCAMVYPSTRRSRQDDPSRLPY